MTDTQTMAMHDHYTVIIT